LCNGNDCTSLFRLLPLLAIANAAVIITWVVEPAPLLSSGSGNIANGDVVNSHSVWAPAQLLRADRRLGLLGVITACYYLPVYGCIATLLVYLKTHFAFDQSVSAVWLACLGGSATITCSIGAKVLSDGFGFGPKKIIKIGLAALFFAQVGLGLGNVSGEFYAAGLLFGVGFSVMPSVNVLVSEVASAQQQGTAQGAMHAIKALTEGVGPLLFAVLFKIFPAEAYGGVPFLVGSAFVAAAFLVATRIPAIDSTSTSSGGDENGGGGSGSDIPTEVYL
jgi:hypothetical protein